MSRRDIEVSQEMGSFNEATTPSDPSIVTRIPSQSTEDGSNEEEMTTRAFDTVYVVHDINTCPVPAG